MSAAAGSQRTSVSMAPFNLDAITLLKVWGSVGEVGPALGYLVKRLLVKFNRQFWFKPLSTSLFLCFTVLFLFTLFNVLPAAFSSTTSSSTSSFSLFFFLLLCLHRTSLPTLSDFAQMDVFCFLYMNPVSLLLPFIHIISFYPVTFSPTMNHRPIRQLHQHYKMYIYLVFFFR